MSADDYTERVEEPSGQDLMISSLDEQAEAQIRRVWHEGRWFFSVIDVIGLLTDSSRRYWTDMKSQFQDNETFGELCEQCHQAKMVARDGKLRETDCADITTMTALIQYLPMQYRRQPMVGSAGGDLCGVYTILNNITQDQYIGSSMNIATRFAQHRSLLHRGRHYADRLQEAWTAYGESAFSMIVLEQVADPSYLVTAEQRHFG
jgi:GIY-YIG catalytic domain